MQLRDGVESSGDDQGVKSKTSWCSGGDSGRTSCQTRGPAAVVSRGCALMLSSVAGDNTEGTCSVRGREVVGNQSLCEMGGYQNSDAKMGILWSLYAHCRPFAYRYRRYIPEAND